MTFNFQPSDMPTILLIRHGENDFVKTSKLAGRLPGVHLNARGQKQAEALGEALKDVPIRVIYSSPLERALETAAPIASPHNLQIVPDPDLMDTNVGKWQGRSWKVLRRTKAWKIVQSAPSRFRFPEGESFPETQLRVVNVIEQIVRKHRPPDVIAVVFHADPIKLAVAHFIGMPLDNFQKLACDTGSVTILAVHEMGASLLKLSQRPPFDLLQPSKKK